MKSRKKYKSYCNENYLRFNLTEDQIWRNFYKEFGEERAEELNQLFVDRYKDSSKGNPYNFCKNFRETSTLMYFQSDFFLENSLKILELFEEIKPTNILELGCYNGILLNYLAEKYPSQNFIGVDIEEKIIGFAKEKFSQKNLNFLPLEYKSLYELEDKYDLIFTIFGLENIPSDIKLDKFEIRNNNDYQARYDYFNDFFNNLKKIIKDKALFCPIVRIPDLNCLMAFFDAASINQWNLKDNKVEFIESRNYNSIERIPFFILEHSSKETNNKKIEVDNFFEITERYRSEDNLRYIYLYNKNKSNFNEVIKNGEIFYKDDQNTLYYKIYKRLGNFMLFFWATDGFSYYGEFKNLDELKKLFLEYTSKELEL